MNKLEITYEITGFDRVLYNQRPSWNNCEFFMEKEDLAVLRIWEDGINDKSQVEQAIKEINKKTKQLILYFEFRYERPLTHKMISKKIPTVDESPHVSDTLSLKCECVGEVVPAAPPAEMPSLPLECERWVLTLAEAYIFGQYVEEQLKRQYLIIEELLDEFKEDFAEQEELKKEIKLIRDFTSHPNCENEAIIKLVSKKLPTSKIEGGDKTSVRFLRNEIDHRKYVADYAVDSRRIARALVEKKIAQINQK